MNNPFNTGNAYNDKLLFVHYKSSLDFAGMLTEEQRKGKSVEQYAYDDTIDWGKRMKKLSAQEANEQMVDVSSGRKLGKRKDVETRYEL